MSEKSDKAIINTSTLDDIGNAIRFKNGETEKYHPYDMPAKIRAIDGDGGYYTGIDPIVVDNENGTISCPDWDNYDVKNGDGFKCVNLNNNSVWTSLLENLTITKETISATINNNRFSYGGLQNITDIVCAENKQIYVSAKVKLTNSNCTRVSIKYFGTSGGSVAGTGTLLQTNPVVNTEYILYGVITLPSNFSGSFKVSVIQEYSTPELAYEKEMVVSNIMIIDCTDTFNNTVELSDVQNLISLYGGFISRQTSINDIKAITNQLIGYSENKMIEKIGLSCVNVNNNSDWTSSTENLTITEEAINATIRTQSYGDLHFITGITCEKDKQIYVSAKVKLTNSNCTRVSIKYFGTSGGSVAGTGTLLQTNPVVNTEYLLYGVIKLTEALSGSFKVSVIQEYSSAELALGKEMVVSDIMILDISEAYGKYLEPSTEEIEYIISKIGYFKNVENLLTTKDIYQEKEVVKDKVKINSMPFIMPSITRSQRPILTITYDDCSNTIYDYAYPVHKSKNAPATFYVIPSFIGTGLLKDYGYADDWDRIVEMDNNGIKIECHSYAHNYLPNLTEDGLKDNFEKSIKLFARYGIDVNHISYPGGYYDDKVQMMSQEYFQSGRTTGGHYSDPIINGYDVQPYVIGAYCFDNRNVTWFKNRIDDAFDNNKWLCVFLHAIHPDGEVPSSLPEGTRTCMTPSELAEVIDYANNKGVEIVTLEEALRTFAPIYYWCDRNANSPMVIQRNGVIANNVQGQDPFLNT